MERSQDRGDTGSRGEQEYEQRDELRARSGDPGYARERRGSRRREDDDDRERAYPAKRESYEEEGERGSRRRAAHAQD
jgi:hypothetical protein